MTDYGAWAPPSPPRWSGALARNQLLTAAQLWPTLDGAGPEDAAVDAEGRVYGGLRDGRILRWSGSGGAPEVIASTGGRPLGIEVDRDGSLVVCDAKRGVLRVRGGQVQTLADAYGGARLRFPNNAAIARDGTIYFTDSSSICGVDDYRVDLFHHRGLGRLFALPPGGALRVVADGLYFANGVALSADESYVVVAETTRYRLLKVPLDGGRPVPLHENLPGFPDNLSTSPRGTFWVPLPAPRDRALDLLLPRPGIRRLVSKLPERLQPQEKRYGLVLEIDASGRVQRSLHDPTGRVAMLTGAREHAGRLYLGSLSEPAMAVVSL